MKRKIVTIDRDACNGCGLCVNACHEGALQMVDGKAKLVSDSYCDGLGACLPKCPVDAIRIEERDAAPFDEAAVLQAQRAKPVPAAAHACPPRGCPGTILRTLAKKPVAVVPAAISSDAAPQRSALRQWPCQVKLVPPHAPFFEGADLLVAADCTAFAHASIHRDFMDGKITLIGCPRLDDVDYAEKLTAILASNDIRSLTVLRMEVPCCGGLADAAFRALAASGKDIPLQVVVIGTEGDVVQRP
jgi:NAD-dependent dihydropyrimidine dehydrogenase PreA subunit